MADDSDSSGLSSAPEEEVKKLAPIFARAKKATKAAFPPPQVSPPRPKRPPSPPHEEVFADNGDIPFIVMFRSRFSEAMPSKLPNYGPQDIERGVTDQPPSPEVQSLLCAVLALVLNRKKPVERGHHGRALEEAVLSQKHQWPGRWNGVNPLHGPKDFNTNMTPTERLDLLRTLALWSLTSSEAIQAILKDKYKQQRHNDDENQPLSVQPWGADGDKRRYFLVQGLEDTHFRVYKEGHRHTKNAYWYSVAGNIDELKALAAKLQDVDGTQAARRLAGRMLAAVPNFEQSQIKRERREYRQIKRAAFSRPEPGFSLYEGRTRGKRARYTYDDEDDQGAFDSDATSGARRSTRNSARGTPGLDAGPMYTASGRQIRQPRQGEYGESLLGNSVGVDGGTDELAPEWVGGEEGDEDEDEEPPTTLGRATRTGGRAARVPVETNGYENPRKRKYDGYNDIDNMSEEEDAAPSGDEWDSDKNGEDEDMPDADDDEADDEVSEDDEPQSLVVKLRLPSESLLKCEAPPAEQAGKGDAANGTDSKMEDHNPLAPKSEPSTTGLTLSNGFTPAEPIAGTKNTLRPHLQQTPPSAASNYPTPASASFPVPETKPTVVAGGEQQQIPQASGLGAQQAAQQNGYGSYVQQQQSVNGY